MPENLETRLRLARPNACGPTLDATSIARERALAALPGRSRRSRILAAAVAVGAATAAVVAFGLRDNGEIASAAQVRAAVSQTLASAKSLRGVLVIRRPEEPDRPSAPKVERWSFAVDSAGDLRLTGLDTRDDLAFDGKRDVLRFSDGRWFSTITGFPPPSRGVSADWILERELGSVIAALAADRDTQVQEVQYAGRPSWLLTIRADVRAGTARLEREITVDRALGLPVHDVLENGDAVLGEWRLENLTVGGGLPPTTFVLAPRPGQEVHAQDEGSRRIAPGEIEGTTGYAPLEATWLPGGYRLDHAAVSPSYTADGTPGSAEIVSFVYRRGLEQIVVTMQPHRASGGTVRPPIAGRFCTAASISAFVCLNTDQTLHSRRVKLTSGALAGEVAKVTIDVAVPPTLAVETSSLDVQISGDVDETELARIADSFAR